MNERAFRLSVAFGALALFCATYLFATDLWGAEPICSSRGCAGWYRSGPLSSIGPIPLSGIGVGAWMVLFGMLKFLSARMRIVLFGAGAMALVSGSLQVIGYAATQSVCPWCLAHAVFATLFAILLKVGGVQSFRDVSPLVFALLFGLGLAFVSPRELADHSPAGIALAQEPFNRIEPAGIELFASKNTERRVLAVVDLNCGHCVNWLQDAATNTEASHPLTVVWASTVSGELPSDANHVADSLGLDPTKLRRYFSEGCKPRPGMGSKNLTPRRLAADALFRRLGIDSTPHFVLYEGAKAKDISGSVAYDLLFKP